MPVDVKTLTILLILGLTIGCTELRVQRYQTILDPMLGKSKKADVDHELGRPTFCKNLNVGEICEYRTARGRNDPVPAAAQKSTLGPDLSPYDYFDVLQIEYDGMGIFKDWTATTIRQ
jgi:hypothetical protein